METSSINIGTANLGASARSASSLADNFDTFLTLLTTQLQNQDPLDPMESGEFTQQLVQFSGVEQSIATNKNLETLIKMSFVNSMNSAVNYLGKYVGAEGSEVQLANGEAEWGYALENGAATTDLLVKDSAGKVVFTTTGGTEAGPHKFVWDGQDNAGGQLPDGIYNLEIAAKNSDGNSVQTTTIVAGRVTGMETLNGEPILLIGETRIPLNKVNSIFEPPAA